MSASRTVPAGKTVHFATTPRISPYITALVAGPYHGSPDHHDGIDLGLWCRKTLAEYLDTDELFQVTKQGFDWYHANFGVRYAFGKYDQVFVPEFNAGAMENAGCVTFREDYVFRSKVTDAALRAVGETILHEMAHMWFGDLVTMRWWDDLWLNESFATYASMLCQTSATRWPNAWTTFANVEKTWAYRQDQLPSTHPIATDAPDVQTAEVNFDGITYAKGRQRAQAARGLRRRRRLPGRPARLLRRARLRQHDARRPARCPGAFVRARARRRGPSCGSRRPASTRIRPEFTFDDDGHYATFELVQSAPTERRGVQHAAPAPAGHRSATSADGTSLVRTGRIELDVSGERTPVEDLLGLSQPDLLLVNDEDLTYCKLRLDERSLRTLRDGGIARLADSLPRALCWSAAWDMTRDGELATRDYLALLLSGAEAETRHRPAAVAQPARAAGLGDLRRPGVGARGLRRPLRRRRCPRCTPPSPARTTSWRGRTRFLGAARSDEHIAVIRGLLDGTHVVDGLAVDPELRWAIVQALCARGAIDDDAIAAELDRDPSAAGQRHAATARALAPTAEAKAEAWRRAVEDDSLPNAMQEAIIAGFAHSTQGELLTPVRRAVLRRGAGRVASGGRANSRRAWSSACSRPGRRRSRPRRWPRPTGSWPGPTCRQRCGGWSARAGPTWHGPGRPAPPMPPQACPPRPSHRETRRRCAPGCYLPPAESASIRRPLTMPPVRSPLANDARMPSAASAQDRLGSRRAESVPVTMCSTR